MSRLETTKLPVVIYTIIYFGNLKVIGQEEFCFRDVFQPSCAPGEIILIEEAYFGRKAMGRCLSDEGVPSETFLADPQFLGCYTDVRSILDPQCSGKRQCDVPVAKIDVQTNCHKFTKLYLEVKHTCLKVVEENQHCRALLSSEKLHLMKSLNTESVCGSKDQPWTIESSPGQKIKLNMVQLYASENSEKFYFADPRQSTPCEQHAKLLDTFSKKISILCSGSLNLASGTESFQSSSNVIEVTFQTGRKSFIYIISIEATGCSNLIPPADAWLKRTENEATIGCYSTRLRWQLKCVGQRWVGVIGNCSHGNQISNSDSSLSPMEKTNENSVVTIVAIAMVGFVICFLIICSGVVFLNRYYALSKSKSMKQMALYNGDLNQALNNAKGQIMDFENNIDGFENGTSMKHIDTRTTVTDDRDQNQQYYELDRSLVKNEVFMKM